MGCHGIAQSQGFAFSFILQDGNKGIVPDTGTSIAIPCFATHDGIALIVFAEEVVGMRSHRFVLLLGVALWPSHAPTAIRASSPRV